MDMIGIKEASFEWALCMLKHGVNMRRKNWNDKCMFVYLTTGSKVPAVHFRPDTAKHIFGDNPIEDITIKINPHIDMMTADGSITIGWAPSQVDMLAEDWEVFK